MGEARHGGEERWVGIKKKYWNCGRSEGMADLLKEEEREVRRIRRALWPLGYFVYGVGKPAMSGKHVEIHARMPENDADRERFEETIRREESLC